MREALFFKMLESTRSHDVRARYMALYHFALSQRLTFSERSELKKSRNIVINEEILSFSNLIDEGAVNRVNELK